MLAIKTEVIINAMFSGAREGYIGLVTLPDAKSRFYHISNIDQMVQMSTRLNDSTSVYYSVGLLKEEPTKGRGDADDICSMHFFWADIDFGQDGHKSDKYAPTMDDAIKIAYQFPLKPSIIYYTGNGVQACWFFEEPWILNDIAEREKAQQLSQQFQKTMQCIAAEYGWDIDNTGDLARILRIPGSKNHKSNPPKQGHVVEFESTRRYSPEAFKVYLKNESNFKLQTKVAINIQGAVTTQRNNTLTSIAGTMRRRGMTKESILAALLEENRQKCIPPLSEEEVERIAESIATRYAPKVSETDAGDVFEGLNYEFNVPENWVVTAKGIQAWTKDGKITVAPAPITIATRLKNADDNTEKVEITFKRDSKWQTIRAERSTVYSKSKIIELTNYGLPVTSETAKYLVNYLAAIEAANDIPLIATVNRLGWINEREFVPFVSNVILDVDGGNAKLANAFKPSGTLEEWVKLVNPMREVPLSRFVLSAGFAAPMMQRLSQRNFAVHIWGDSRAGKSAVAKAALSVWGNPQQGMMTFNTTKVGLEQQVGFLSNLPLVIDEKQIVADKQEFVESLMYMLGEGKGKTRGSKSGGLANYQNWKTLAITTGEHPMSSERSATGVKSRVLELHSQSIVPESYGSTLHQRLDCTHGTAGYEFIRRLIDYTELRELYQCIHQKLQEEAPDLIGSHHSSLAIVSTADVLVSQWIFGEDEDAAIDSCWAMLEAIVKQLETKIEADEATRAMMHFRSWMQENTRRFSDSSMYEYGWICKTDENTVYVNSGAFSKAMKDGGFNAIRVKKDFQSRQWLIPHTNTKGEQMDYKSKRNPDNKNSMVVEIHLPLLA